MTPANGRTSKRPPIHVLPLAVAAAHNSVWLWCDVSEAAPSFRSSSVRASKTLGNSQPKPLVRADSSQECNSPLLRNISNALMIQSLEEAPYAQVPNTPGAKLKKLHLRLARTYSAVAVNRGGNPCVTRSHVPTYRCFLRDSSPPSFTICAIVWATPSKSALLRSLSHCSVSSSVAGEEVSWSTRDLNSWGSCSRSHDSTSLLGNTAGPPAASDAFWSVRG